LKIISSEKKNDAKMKKLMRCYIKAALRFQIERKQKVKAKKVLHFETFHLT